MSKDVNDGLAGLVNLVVGQILERVFKDFGAAASAFRSP